MSKTTEDARRNAVSLRVTLPRSIEEKLKAFCAREHVGMEDALERLINLGLESHDDPERWT